MDPFYSKDYSKTKQKTESLNEKTLQFKILSSKHSGFLDFQDCPFDDFHKKLEKKRKRNQKKKKSFTMVNDLWAYGTLRERIIIQVWGENFLKFKQKKLLNLEEEKKRE